MSCRGAAQVTTPQHSCPRQARKGERALWSALSAFRAGARVVRRSKHGNQQWGTPGRCVACTFVLSGSVLLMPSVIAGANPCGMSQHSWPLISLSYSGKRWKLQLRSRSGDTVKLPSEERVLTCQSSILLEKTIPCVA